MSSTRHKMRFFPPAELVSLSGSVLFVLSIISYYIGWNYHNKFCAHLTYRHLIWIFLNCLAQLYRRDTLAGRQDQVRCKKPLVGINLIALQCCGREDCEVPRHITHQLVPTFYCAVICRLCRTWRRRDCHSNGSTQSTARHSRPSITSASTGTGLMWWRFVFYGRLSLQY